MREKNPADKAFWRIWKRGINTHWGKILGSFLVHILLEEVMLNYYLYLVTKEHKQKPNRLQETRSPFSMCWRCWDCTGAVHSWELFAGGLRLLTLSSFPHSSVVIRARKWPKNVTLGGYLLKISNINNICSLYNVLLATSALSSFPKLPRNAIKIWLRQRRSTLVPCLVFMALGEHRVLLCPALWWQKSTDSSEILPSLHWVKTALNLHQKQISPFLWWD